MPAHCTSHPKDCGAYRRFFGALFDKIFHSSVHVCRRSVLKITDLSKPEVQQVLNIAACIKQDPSVASSLFKQRSLIMLFEKPSLRTRLSFEIGMTQMGGHGVFYSIADSPLGKKESIEDTAQVHSWVLH